MAANGSELERLEASFQRLGRLVKRHLIFLLICIVVALVLRRLLRFPPMLSWVVFAVPAVLFGADFFRYLVCGYKLGRERSHSSNS